VTPLQFSTAVYTLNNTLTAYGIWVGPKYAPKLSSLDHTFVVSDRGDNWSCWGRGREVIPQSHQLAQTQGNAIWADLFHGSDPIHPCGLTEKVSGVCQNVCNRLLLVGDADVSSAGGNELVIILYGKYGFGLDDFINRVNRAASMANQQQAGAVSENDVDAVVSKIKGSEEQEIETLRRHFTEALAAHSANVSEKEQKSIIDFYDSFHDNRERIQHDVPKNGTADDFRGRYLRKLGPALLNYLRSMLSVLGRVRYAAIFKISPEQAVAFLS
jgi:hypothetical protein